MSFHDNDPFGLGHDPVLLTSSDTQWTPTTTEQAPSDDIFGSLELYGEGLDLLQDYAETMDLACMEQMNLEEPEPIAPHVPDYGHIELLDSALRDTSISDPFIPSSNIFTENDPIIENLILDGEAVGSSAETETAAADLSNNSNQIDHPSILLRIINIESKIEEIINWKAQQTRRGTELREMMDEILEMLRGHESRLNSNN
ncbi:hypothetical protein H9Q74_000393 [Fusarium xylarioides]|nr:hypothetical protein H9Q71_010387 [Fusarium xylarioides]KAG5829538.1 hypothetical protein H9Q74_000393 [Fusarium xylarioides]